MVCAGNMDTELLDQVNQIRLEDDLTFAELGDQIGIDGGALHRILSGKSAPMDRTLYKIREFLRQRDAAPRATRRKRAS